MSPEPVHFEPCANVISIMAAAEPPEETADIGSHAESATAPLGVALTGDHGREAPEEATPGAEGGCEQFPFKRLPTHTFPANAPAVESLQSEFKP